MLFIREYLVNVRIQYIFKYCCFCVQSAVRAAINGHILVLEGIEKAERNVLPILNNLLENREMQLEDGRFLVAADRYDKLLQVSDKEMHFRHSSFPQFQCGANNHFHYTIY